MCSRCPILTGHGGCVRDIDVSGHFTASRRSLGRVFAVSAGFGGFGLGGF